MLLSSTFSEYSASIPVGTLISKLFGWSIITFPKSMAVGLVLTSRKLHLSVRLSSFFDFDFFFFDFGMGLDDFFWVVFPRILNFNIFRFLIVLIFFVSSLALTDFVIRKILLFCFDDCFDDFFSVSVWISFSSEFCPGYWLFLDAFSILFFSKEFMSNILLSPILYLKY